MSCLLNLWKLLGIHDTYKLNKGISLLQETQREVEVEPTTSSKA